MSNPLSNAQRRRRGLAGHELDLLAAIALGGVVGAEMRYGLGLLVPHATARWPTATLLVNTTGCFLIGVLMVMINELTEPHRLARPLLGVGLLGGYTTFSTYATDVAQLLSADQGGTALTYLALTPLMALLAAWAGATLTRAASALRRATPGPGGTT